MRVMARSGQLMFTMTPLLGLSWTYDELWETEDPSVFKVKWSLLDNPFIADAAVPDSGKSFGRVGRIRHGISLSLAL